MLLALRQLAQMGVLFEFCVTQRRRQGQVGPPELLIGFFGIEIVFRYAKDSGFAIGRDHGGSDAFHPNQAGGIQDLFAVANGR